MLPMPALRVTTVSSGGRSGIQSATAAGAAGAGQSSQSQAQPESSSYFQHLLESVKTIDLEAGTSSSSVHSI